MNKFSTRFLKRLLPLGLAASAVAVLLAPGLANATPYVVKLVQQGKNVVATGSGAFDLSGLSLYATGPGDAGIVPNSSEIGTGPLSASLDVYTAIFTGPTSFGSGTGILASSGSGDLAIIEAVDGVMAVPAGYISEANLLGTSTYDNADFASLGVTPGTYVWTWGTGADQSFTLDIVSAVTVPEPAALGMFGFGVLLVGAFVGLRRRTA